MKGQDRKADVLRCPTCDMIVDIQVAAACMPFCSRRCQMIDLGRWLNEEISLPCEVNPPDDDDDGEAHETSSPTIRLPPGWHDA